MNLRLSLLKLLLVLVCVSCHLSPARISVATDYELELGQINDEISQSSNRLAKTSFDKKKDLKRIFFLYHKASLTGNFTDYKKTETEINQAIHKYGASADLYLYRAYLNFHLHRLQKAKQDLQLLPDLAHPRKLQILKTDIDFQEGRYAKAEQGYENIVREKRSWDTLSRLAYYKLMTGHPIIAEQLYDEAAEKLSAKEMRSFAWIELQKGLIDLQFERYEQALSHYQRAKQAYSGYWLIEEHIAEVLNLLDRKQEAIALYNKIITKTGNPEFITALANILESLDPELSSELQTQAESIYASQFQLFPEAAIGHLVQHLLAKKHPGPKLLEYAKKNVQFRPNAKAKFLLAQSYLKFNQPDPAKKLLQEILETPWRTPQLLKIVAALKEPGLQSKLKQ